MTSPPWKADATPAMVEWLSRPVFTDEFFARLDVGISEAQVEPDDGGAQSDIVGPISERKQGVRVVPFADLPFLAETGVTYVIKGYPRPKPHSPKAIKKRQRRMRKRG